MKVQQNEHGTEILLEDEKDLRAYIHPLRQRIMAALERCPQGMSAKQLADTLGIAPSSAGHHLKILEEIGLVVLDRVENIHGFQAKIYKEAIVTVRIGNVPSKENLQAVLIQEELARRTQRLLEAAKEAGEDEKKEENQVKFSAGVVYCSPEEITGFAKEVAHFMQMHTDPAPGKIPFETTFFYYTSQMADEALGKKRGDGKNAKKE